MKIDRRAFTKSLAAAAATLALPPWAADGGGGCNAVTGKSGHEDSHLLPAEL